MIGLGGSSLTKRHLPGEYITAIEIKPKVIALRNRFRIRPDDERLTVVCADAARFMSTTAQTFDALLLDGFNADGTLTTLSGMPFYKACHARLSDDGVLLVNLFALRDGARAVNSQRPMLLIILKILEKR